MLRNQTSTFNLLSWTRTHGLLKILVQRGVFWNSDNIFRVTHLWWFQLFNLYLLAVGVYFGVTVFGVWELWVRACVRAWSMSVISYDTYTYWSVRRIPRGTDKQQITYLICSLTGVYFDEIESENFQQELIFSFYSNAIYIFVNRG
jgi:hypothetical protein